MPKLKPHKGLLKRVKITASGKVKFSKRGKSHLNSVMPGKRTRQLRNKTVASGADVRMFESMLHTRLRGR